MYLKRKHINESPKAQLNVFIFNLIENLIIDFFKDEVFNDHLSFDNFKC